MKLALSVFLLSTLLSQVYMAPQFITFKDGKLGVNFGGYHAGVGIGGLLGGGGTAGGLFAEAGTPNGQSARAGLGGTVNEKGGASGGLFAGATAGGNVKASAGLAGGVNAEKSAGGGYASAQAGERFASSGLAGETALQGGYEAAHTIEVKPINTHVKTEVNIDSINEVKPVEFVPLNHAEQQTKVHIKSDIPPPVVVKEVYVEPQPVVVEKHVVHTHKPHRHHLYKTAFLGGYVGNRGEIVPPSHQTETVVHKKLDVGAEAHANAGASIGGDGYGKTDHTYTKQVTFQRNPSFFEDIFNIPISTLKAVGNFLGNTAAHTNVSVQKSASIQAAESNSEPVILDSSTDSSSNAPISVESSKTSSLFDDIFAIPISTLGAVNKFLENNVASRKNVENHEEK